MKSCYCLSIQRQNAREIFKINLFFFLPQKAVVECNRQIHIGNVILKKVLKAFE